MSEHNHSHEHTPVKQGIPVDPADTRRLYKEAHTNLGTPVGYFLAKAAEAQIKYERAYWMRRVDGARYTAKLATNRARLTQRAIENMEAENRLSGTEGSLKLERIVGNAVVLSLIPGVKAPPGGYSLVRRTAGETGTEGYGAPRGTQWVIQNLRMNTIQEFAVISQDNITAKEVQGPWLAVPIGNISTDQINAAEEARAKQEYEANEAEEAQRIKEHAEQVAQRREGRAEALREQQEQADIDNARREREIEEQRLAHEKAVSELHLVGPRNMEIRLRDTGAGIVADIKFMRGVKAPDFYQFVVNNNVLGYYPDGRHSGRKSENHIYERSVPVIPGQDNRVHIYGSTPHGNGGNPITIPVPKSLCDEEAPNLSRMELIMSAIRIYTGPRTRNGAPYLRDLRRQANISDITSKERYEAYKKVKNA